jgi:hypothetical protein
MDYNIFFLSIAPPPPELIIILSIVVGKATELIIQNIYQNPLLKLSLIIHQLVRLKELLAP